MINNNKNIKLCKQCKSFIIRHEDEYLKNKTEYWHVACFRTKEQNKKRNKLSNHDIEGLIEEMKQNTIIEENKILNKEKFFEWIQISYDIAMLDNYFFTKIASINNGTYKGLVKGISCEDLLYIFKAKKSNLDEIANKKTSKGENFSDAKSRLNYDLAVVLNKYYDSYRKWKEKQKILEADKIKPIETSIDYTQIHVSKTQIYEDDINSLLDEVF